jgi:hypothetical protein
MIERRTVAGRIAIFLALFCISAGAGAQDFTIFSTFSGDTPGAPPMTGGPDQPTTIINGGVLVKTNANGISSQPLEVSDGDCSASSFYFGGVTYDLPAPVEDGVLRIEATVAVNQLTTGIFFDTDTEAYGPGIARLQLNGLGQITDNVGTVLGDYTANTPLRFRADIDMASKTWACTIDDELNGFEDDMVMAGLAFTNDPAIINQIGRVHLVLYGSFNIYTCTPPRSVAYDDVLITTLIFKDGFESGATDAWSNTIGLSQASVSWYDDPTCSSLANTGGPYAADQCVQMPGESIYVKFDCASGSSDWYWDGQCTSLRAAGCDSNLCCEVPFSSIALDSLVWTCP